MSPFTITNIGVYREQQSFRQDVDSPWICFYASGLIYSRATLPDGHTMEEPQTPFFCFRVPGSSLDFSFSAHRENWVIMLDTKNLRYAPAKRCVEWREEGGWIDLPLLFPVQPEWVPYWQSELRLMQAAQESPVPRNLWRARLGVLNIIRFALDGRSESLQETPAAELKRHLDEDERGARSLEEWAAICGYSSDHLRIRFEREYGITPLAYRNQRRMAKAMQLVSSSRLTVQEIAARLGFRHPSHFSAAFRDSFQCSPSEGVRRFRHS